MKKPKDSPYPKVFGELDDLKNNEIPRPKLKQENEITNTPMSIPVPTFWRRGTFFAIKKSGSITIVSVPQ